MPQMSPPPPQYTHLRFTYHLVAMIKMEYPSFILKVGVIVSLSLSLTHSKHICSFEVEDLLFEKFKSLSP